MQGIQRLDQFSDRIIHFVNCFLCFRRIHPVFVFFMIDITDIKCD